MEGLNGVPSVAGTEDGKWLQELRTACEPRTPQPEVKLQRLKVKLAKAKNRCVKAKDELNADFVRQMFVSF